VPTRRASPDANTSVDAISSASDSCLAPVTRSCSSTV
jgi:hypothetical protein